MPFNCSDFYPTMRPDPFQHNIGLLAHFDGGSMATTTDFLHALWHFRPFDDHNPPQAPLKVTDQRSHYPVGFGSLAIPSSNPVPPSTASSRRHSLLPLFLRFLLDCSLMHAVILALLTLTPANVPLSYAPAILPLPMCPYHKICSVAYCCPALYFTPRNMNTTHLHLLALLSIYAVRCSQWNLSWFLQDLTFKNIMYFDVETETIKTQHVVFDETMINNPNPPPNHARLLALSLPSDPVPAAGSDVITFLDIDFCFSPFINAFFLMNIRVDYDNKFLFGFSVSTCAILKCDFIDSVHWSPVQCPLSLRAFSAKYLGAYYVAFLHDTPIFSPSNVNQVLSSLHAHAHPPSDICLVLAPEHCTDMHQHC